MFWGIKFTIHTLKFFWTKFPSDQRHHFRIEVREFEHLLVLSRKGQHILWWWRYKPIIIHVYS